MSLGVRHGDVLLECIIVEMRLLLNWLTSRQVKLHDDRCGLFNLAEHAVSCHLLTRASTGSIFWLSCHMIGMAIERDFRKLTPATQAELRRVAVAMVRGGKTRIAAAKQ